MKNTRGPRPSGSPGCGTCDPWSGRSSVPGPWPPGAFGGTHRGGWHRRRLGPSEATSFRRRRRIPRAWSRRGSTRRAHPRPHAGRHGSPPAVVSAARLNPRRDRRPKPARRVRRRGQGRLQALRRLPSARPVRRRRWPPRHRSRRPYRGRRGSGRRRACPLPREARGARRRSVRSRLGTMRPPVASQAAWRR